MVFNGVFLSDYEASVAYWLNCVLTCKKETKYMLRNGFLILLQFTINNTRLIKYTSCLKENQTIFIELSKLDPISFFQLIKGNFYNSSWEVDINLNWFLFATIEMSFIFTTSNVGSIFHIKWSYSIVHEAWSYFSINFAPNM